MYSQTLFQKNFRESTGDISKCIEDLKHDLERHKQALLRQEQLKVSHHFGEYGMEFE